MDNASTVGFYTLLRQETLPARRKPAAALPVHVPPRRDIGVRSLEDGNCVYTFDGVGAQRMTSSNMALQQAVAACGNKLERQQVCLQPMRCHCRQCGEGLGVQQAIKRVDVGFGKERLRVHLESFKGVAVELVSVRLSSLVH